MRLLPLVLGTCLLLGGCGDEKSFRDLAVQGVYTGSLSSDGKFALVGSINHGGSFWNLTQGQRLYNWNHQADSYSFLSASAISGDGKVAVTTDRERGLVFWNTTTGKPMGYWQTPGEANSIALDHSGTRALVGLTNNQVLVLDRLQGGISQILYHSDIVNAVAITPDGKLGLSGSDDQQAKLWNLDQGKELYYWELGHKVVTVALSDDGRYQFAAAQSRPGRLFSGDKQLAELGLARQTQSSARFSRDGTQLLTGSSAGDVYLWTVPGGEKQTSWHLGRKDIWKPTGISVRDLAFAGGKRVTAVGSNGRSYDLVQ